MQGDQHAPQIGQKTVVGQVDALDKGQAADQVRLQHRRQRVDEQNGAVDPARQAQVALAEQVADVASDRGHQGAGQRGAQVQRARQVHGHDGGRAGHAGHIQGQVSVQIRAARQPADAVIELHHRGAGGAARFGQGDNDGVGDAAIDAPHRQAHQAAQGGAERGVGGGGDAQRQVGAGIGRLKDGLAGAEIKTDLRVQGSAERGGDLAGAIDHQRTAAQVQRIEFEGVREL